MGGQNILSNKVVEKILRGLSDNNIKFNDLCTALLNLGFTKHVKGDHHIFTRNDVKEIINLQPLENGKAKSYQVKQVRNLILKYSLHREVNDVQI